MEIHSKIYLDTEKYKHLVEHLYESFYEEIKKISNENITDKELSLKAMALYSISIFPCIARDFSLHDTIEFLFYFLTNILDPIFSSTTDKVQRRDIYVDISRIIFTIFLDRDFSFSEDHQKKLLEMTECYLDKMDE
jgi:hypothetical protein